MSDPRSQPEAPDLAEFATLLGRGVSEDQNVLADLRLDMFEQFLLLCAAEGEEPDPEPITIDCVQSLETIADFAALRRSRSGQATRANPQQNRLTDRRVNIDTDESPN